MTERREFPQRLYGIKRWIYRGDRPNLIARALNRFWARQHAAARLSRDRDVTLQVRGRVSGRDIAVPVVMADRCGQWYVVSMLGERANWVRNLRAAGGRAVIVRGTAHCVDLEETPTNERAPILKRYLEVAPAARPHFPLGCDAPISDFERIAPDHPVFKVIGLPSAPRH